MATRSSSTASSRPPGQDLLRGFIRLHILHHAAEHAVVGAWMMEELQRHGYRIGPGTLYPMLHAMEKAGYLRSRTLASGRRHWREYRITAAGRAALRTASRHLRELFHELIPDSPPPP
ncbi:MAG: PadR family transcriptional regulator [Puniceicoccaceae bacterium]|nr:MAG: PadR family transcriptional regulator [Puniceicoccaceae bacterium]